VAILTQFIFRLCFGMALGMALTSPRQVTSGYYRNHLYVLLGLNVLAAMVAVTSTAQTFPFWPPVLAAVLSYVGSVLWLYEKPRAGIVVLALLAALGLWGALEATNWNRANEAMPVVVVALNPISSGLLLGLTMAAMFLGHWYLNSPTMAIGPLEKLVLLMGGAVGVRAVVDGAILVFYLSGGLPSTAQLLFIALRWLSGIIGPVLLVVMTYKTLKIPNTQSATGILYVCVIATFLGELTSLLLSLPTAAKI
jgi:hypothetical protein